MNLQVVILLATLCWVQATLDWSNLDLINYEYFKYPPATTEKPIFYHQNGQLYSIRMIPEKPNKFQDIISKSQAVIEYFRILAFGKDNERLDVTNIIDPNKSEFLSKEFQLKHGERAEKLVEFLGSGPSHENLIKANVI